MAGEGQTESQSEAWGRPSEAILAISLVLPSVSKWLRRRDWLNRSTFRLAIF